MKNNYHSLAHRNWLKRVAKSSSKFVSAVLLWLPLGFLALARGRRVLSERRFHSGVLMGVLAHVLVPLVGIAFVLVIGDGLRAV